ncbi:MAG: DUF5615 family PIN-like protein [Planctomycetales bacterium]|nr:DUF5615 family PIN-like protein [Planctomycetales bacterium]
MRFYLDDDTTSGRLIQILRRDGHDVQIPLDVGLAGDSDAVHLTHAIRETRVLMTCNYDDFNHLHLLIAESGGSHPGIFLIRKDNDPRRDMAPHHVALAIKKLLQSGLAIANQVITLNHWR